MYNKIFFKFRNLILRLQLNSSEIQEFGNWNEANNSFIKNSHITKIILNKINSFDSHWFLLNIKGQKLLKFISKIAFMQYLISKEKKNQKYLNVKTISTLELFVEELNLISLNKQKIIIYIKIPKFLYRKKISENLYYILSNKNFESNLKNISVLIQNFKSLHNKSKIFLRDNFRIIYHDSKDFIEFNSKL